jgi:transposase InsO family protein
MRHNLQVKSLRLKRLEEWAAENTDVLTESQVKALEEAKEKQEVYGEVESPHPGFLVAQDTFYVGTIKGVGRIYQQTAIDTHSNVGFAKVYTDKTALCAADLLNDKALPFFDDHNIRVLRVLTDNGREFCGMKDNHPYELHSPESFEGFLHLNDIEHTKTKVRRPQTNGSVERLNQTIKNEFYEVAFRKKLYLSVEEIQADLDEFMNYYNEEQTNQGKYCLGRTPLQTFTEGLDVYRKSVFEEIVDEEDVA